MDQGTWENSSFRLELVPELREVPVEEVEPYELLREHPKLRRGLEFITPEDIIYERHAELVRERNERQELNDHEAGLYRGSDGWSHTFDNVFARYFFQDLPVDMPGTENGTVLCCDSCNSVVAADCTIHLSESLCNSDGMDIRIVRDHSFLRVGTLGPRILRVCADPEYSTDPNNHYYDMPISFPVLPKAGSPTYFALLRTWLRWCDESHFCNKRDAKTKPALPTRLLWVGNLDDEDYDPNTLRLDISTDKTAGEYVALSHRWGQLPTEVKTHFCTTPDNISRRRGGFSIWELPRTFQDAVKVTRELRIPFLWIDSLCIIQYEASGEDWQREARRMEEVFSGAYCTIAATSASNSYTGFLERGIRSEYVHVQAASGREFYVCSDIDDFENDVENAPLSQRSWVMQERVLSARTIHFTANQTYWECGEGVHCENFARLKSPHRKRFFILDPNFPTRLLRSGYQRTTEFIHFLFEDYSKRGLTEKTDRCVAISGLETRIAGALRCESRYGIFDNYFHRNLLWHASDSKMTEIDYKPRHVPSWSWMAYNGAIQFMDKDIPFGEVRWAENLRFHEEREYALVADVGKFQDGLKLDERHVVLDSSDEERGWIRYDVRGEDEETRDLREERCVVVGMEAEKGAKTYYILVVKPTKEMEGDYRRVGVGLIQSPYVVRQLANVRVV